MKISFASWRGCQVSEAGRALPHTCAKRSAIIPILASNSPFFMFLGVPGLRPSAFAILLLAAATAVLVSCGTNYNNNSFGTTPGANPATIKVHVFVSNPLFPNGTSTAPVLNVVDGQRDLLSTRCNFRWQYQPHTGPDGPVSQQEVHPGFQCLEQLHHGGQQCQPGCRPNLRWEVGFDYAARI